MRRLDRRAVIAGLALLPLRAHAHGGHGATAWLRSARWSDDGLHLVVLVLNETETEVTLQGVACDAARSVVFARERSVLGVALLNRVESLALAPNELVRLGDGRYRLVLRGVDPAAAELSLCLDFGRDGTVRVAVPVPPR